LGSGTKSPYLLFLRLYIDLCPLPTFLMPSSWKAAFFGGFNQDFIFSHNCSGGAALFFKFVSLRTFKISDVLFD
jgi:hypothetical protein